MVRDFAFQQVLSCQLTHSSQCARMDFKTVQHILLFSRSGIITFTQAKSTCLFENCHMRLFFRLISVNLSLSWYTQFIRIYPSHFSTEETGFSLQFCLHSNWMPRISKLMGKNRMFSPALTRLIWRRKWEPTPVSLLGKSHSQKSLAGYSPWGSQRVGHDWSDLAHTTRLIALILTSPLSPLSLSHILHLYI